MFFQKMFFPALWKAELCPLLSLEVQTSGFGPGVFASLGVLARRSGQQWTDFGVVNLAVKRSALQVRNDTAQSWVAGSRSGSSLELAFDPFDLDADSYSEASLEHVELC